MPQCDSLSQEGEVQMTLRSVLYTYRTWLLGRIALNSASSCRLLLISIFKDQSWSSSHQPPKAYAAGACMSLKPSGWAQAIRPQFISLWLPEFCY